MRDLILQLSKSSIYSTKPVMSYGNSEEESMEHTGTQLRIAAYGPHAANVVGLTDQTDLFTTMKAALSLK